MVHLDYEILDSNRVLENREKYNLYEQRISRLSGGRINTISSLSVGAATFLFFYRRLGQIPFYQRSPLHRGFKLFLSLLSVLPLMNLVYYGGVVNLGDPKELSRITSYEHSRELANIIDMRDNISLRNYNL